MLVNKSGRLEFGILVDVRQRSMRESRLKHPIHQVQQPSLRNNNKTKDHEAKRQREVHVAFLHASAHSIT